MGSGAAALQPPAGGSFYTSQLTSSPLAWQGDGLPFLKWANQTYAAAGGFHAELTLAWSVFAVERTDPYTVFVFLAPVNATAIGVFSSGRSQKSTIVTNLFPVPNIITNMMSI